MTENRPNTLQILTRPPSVLATQARMIAFSADTLTLLAISDAFRDQLQLTPSTLTTLKLSDLLCHPGEEKLRSFAYQLHHGAARETALNVVLKRVDGSTLPTRLQFSLLPLSDNPVIIAMTEAMPHAESMRTSVREERLEHIAARVPALLFQMRQGPNGLLQFSFLSQACENLLGLAPEVLYANARQFFTLIAEEDRDSWAALLRDSAEKMAVLSWEGRLKIRSWQDTKWITLRACPEDDGENGIRWTGLMINISRSKHQETMLRQSRADLSDLYQYKDREQEEEHAHLRQALHDDLGGNLSALKMMLSHVWNSLPESDALVTPKSYLDKTITRSIRLVQQIATELRPGVLDDGLVAALQWLAAEQENQTGIHYAFRCNAEDIRLDPVVATSLFRIAQTACDNIREYSLASAAEIHVYDGCSELLMEIIDNGKGHPSSEQHNLLSYRLREMEERVALLGGSFNLASRSGKGTLITLRVPLPDNPGPEL